MIDDAFENDFSTRTVSEWVRHKYFSDENVNEIDFWDTTRLESWRYWKIYFFVKEDMLWVLETEKMLKLIEKWLNEFLQEESMKNDWLEFNKLKDYYDHLDWVSKWSCKKHVLLRWTIYD